jgi:hypothetical protein
MGKDSVWIVPSATVLAVGLSIPKLNSVMKQQVLGSRANIKTSNARPVIRISTLRKQVLLV